MLIPKPIFLKISSAGGSGVSAKEVEKKVINAISVKIREFIRPQGKRSFKYILANNVL